MEMRDLILSHIQEGVILTDSKGKISYMNLKSEQILGLRHQHTYYHDAGCLEPGDWILIVDSALGVDDGGLSTQDLQSLGLKEICQKHDGLLLWAKMKGDTCFSNIISQHQKNLSATLVNPELPIVNRAALDFKHQLITIQIGDMTFHKPYKMAYGYMVILSETGQLKFYQEDGYSIRHESIRDIINGKSFRAKGDAQVMSLIGQNINTCFVDYHQLDHGEAHLINGIPVVINVQEIHLGQEIHKLYILEDVTALSQQKRLREEALQSLERLKSSLNEETKWFESFHGISDTIRETMRSAQKASLVDSHMLITGESGTGKSLIAKEVHKSSARQHMPFISVNCSSIPESLFESEMYGYVKGAFTGANTTGKIGYFEAANGGTLFLDEIAELSLVNQAKLLHAIQEQRITRLGSTTVIQLDIRIIVATNKDLMEEVHKKRFREDLYYRLNVIALAIPPLRYRQADIRYLGELTFKALSRKFPKQPPQAIEQFIQSLMVQPLYGNVRELENKIERFLAMGESVSQDYKFLSEPDATANFQSYTYEMTTFETRLIQETLATSGNEVKKAYETLGMKRSTFYDRIKKLNITIPKT
jgi:transcriptional regulator with PAS, ATPase and Fis domain